MSNCAVMSSPTNAFRFFFSFFFYLYTKSELFKKEKNKQNISFKCYIKTMIQCFIKSHKPIKSTAVYLEDKQPFHFINVSL